MSIAVTGATGQLGRHVVDALLNRGVSAQDIIATGRDVDRIADLADLGVTVRRADLAQQDGLEEALTGADRMLLISTTTVGDRFDNHRRAVDAARSAGVGLVVYTSTTHADTATMKLAVEHLATERYLGDSGVPHTVLRNGWYLENYLSQLATILEHHALLGAAGDGRFTPAVRRDYAEAAAVVLTTDGHQDRVYELGGDQVMTLSDLARTIAAASGRPVAYTDLPPEQYRDVLLGAGVPAPLADVLADSDLGLARGELLSTTGDLRTLLGRPTTSIDDSVRTAVDALTAAHHTDR